MMDWTVYAAAELSGQDPPMADEVDTGEHCLWIVKPQVCCHEYG